MVRLKQDDLFEHDREVIKSFVHTIAGKFDYDEELDQFDYFIFDGTKSETGIMTVDQVIDWWKENRE